MSKHRVIVVCLLMASLQAVAALKAEPSSASDVLILVKQIADERAMARDDFYTQDELGGRHSGCPV